MGQTRGRQQLASLPPADLAQLPWPGFEKKTAGTIETGMRILYKPFYRPELVEVACDGGKQWDWWRVGWRRRWMNWGDYSYLHSWPEITKHQRLLLNNYCENVESWWKGWIYMSENLAVDQNTTFCTRKTRTLTEIFMKNGGLEIFGKY